MTDLHKTKVINNEHTNNYYLVIYSRICNGLQDIGHGLFGFELTSYVKIHVHTNEKIPRGTYGKIHVGTYGKIHVDTNGKITGLYEKI
jgi:hypothetical protein